MFTFKCWICGAAADSAEHMVKASDVRSIFGSVTHHTPVYRHSTGDANRLVRGVDVDALKFKRSICQQCNNARTQSHDRAWEVFGSAVRAIKPTLKKGDRIPVSRIFPGSVKASMLAMHLYCLKQLGCHAVENHIPLPLNHFALCIQSEVAHPWIRLIFVSIPTGLSKYQIQVGDIKTLNRGGKTICAVWHYRVGTLGVFVSYAEPGHPRLTEDRGWHPDDLSSRICMA